MNAVLKTEIPTVQLLRTALGLGSLVMLLAGLRLALQPQTIPMSEVKTGINQLVEEGRFQMHATQKPVVPGLALLWGGVLGLSMTLLVPNPTSVDDATPSRTPAALNGTPTPNPKTLGRTMGHTMSRTVHGYTLTD
ncbi:MAG: hypothetical protein AAFY72_08465, partial [Cyanobacteria bacterium J06649_4]